jgi:ABC-2 type transport system permease protein
MFNYKVLAVIKKELREKLFSKSFILTTLLIPLFMFGILGIQTFLIQFSDEKVSLIIAGEDQNFISRLREEFENQEEVKNKINNINFEIMDKEEIESFVNRHKDDLLEDKLNGIVFIPESSYSLKKVGYYSKTPNSASVFNTIRGPINKVLMDLYFSGLNLTSEDISYATMGVDFNQYKISSDKEIEEAGGGNMIVAFLFTFLLYMSLLMIGSRMMTSVIEEKTSRVVEILLSSMDSRDLLTGKILGTTITSVLQMVVWLSPLILLISTTWFMLPQEFIISIDFSQILYFLFNYFIGLITFLGLFASVGSLFENSQDAQQGMWPILILIMIPFFIAIGMISNPETSIVRISSMLPFTSLIVMPARMTIVDVPSWQFILSILVNTAVMLLIFPVAGKIYRIGILKTGKKPKITEIIKWLRYSS